MTVIPLALLLSVTAPATYFGAHPLHLTATLRQTAFAKNACVRQRARLLFADVFYGTRTVFNGDVGTTVWISQLQWACEKHGKKTRFYEYLDSPKAASDP